MHMIKTATAQKSLTLKCLLSPEVPNNVWKDIILCPFKDIPLIFRQISKHNPSLFFWFVFLRYSTFHPMSCNVPFSLNLSCLLLLSVHKEHLFSFYSCRVFFYMEVPYFIVCIWSLAHGHLGYFQSLTNRHLGYSQSWYYYQCCTFILVPLCRCI